MIVDETLDSVDTFLSIALHHGMIGRSQAEKILQKASGDKCNVADAALQLSILNSQEVDAIQVLQKPDDLVAGFRILRVIGCGGSGIVFRAKQIALDREVAIKTVSLKDPSNTTSIGRIDREGRAIAKLNHPNIVSIFDSGFKNGRFCLVLELVEGEDLGSRIERVGPLTEILTWRIAKQIASALSHADAFGIIHRDIKPGNILLTDQTQGSNLQGEAPLAKVADFGLARETNDSQQGLTLAGTALGTPSYVAPEQLKDTNVDRAADIYSLGATVFHMLTGKAPMSEMPPMSAIVAKISGDDSWRERLQPGLAPESVRLFRSMTERDPLQRISRYEDLIEQLDCLIKSLESTNDRSESSLRIAEHGDIARNRISNRFLLLVVLGLAVTSFLFLAAFGGRMFVRSESNQSQTSDELASLPQYTLVRNPIPLFDGLGVPFFSQTGNWSVDRYSLLSGSEKARMTIPLSNEFFSSSNYRFTMSLAVSEGSRCDVVLPKSLVEAHNKNAANYVIVFANGNASLQSEPPGMMEKAIPNNTPVTLRNVNPAEGVFDEVEIAHYSGVFLVLINGKPLFRLRDPGRTVHELTIRVPIGVVSLADLELTEIAKVEPDLK